MAERNAIVGADGTHAAHVAAISGTSSAQLHQWERSVGRAASCRY